MLAFSVTAGVTLEGRQLGCNTVSNGTILQGDFRQGVRSNSRSSQMNEFSWTALISKHTRSGQGRQALRIYEEMRDSGVQPTTYTYVAALKACSILQDLESVRHIHAHVVQSGMESDAFVGAKLVDVYVKCKSLAEARNVFEKIRRPDVVLWTAMILGYAHMDEGTLALKLYEQMQSEGVAPDARAFIGALKACRSLASSEQENRQDGRGLKARCLRQLRSIHADIVKSGCESSLFVGNLLVDVYAKCGCLAEASSFFEAMPHRDVVSWNALIFGYSNMEMGKEALDLYDRMQNEGVVPDDRTYVAALKACSILAGAENGDEADGMMLVKRHWLKQVQTIHSDISRSGCESTMFVGTMLVDAYAKCGSVVDARRVFEMMPRRDVLSWNALILGHAQVNEGECSLQLYAEMQREGVVPNDRTFVCVLKACSSLAGQEDWEVSHGKHLKERSLQHVRRIHSDVLEKQCESDLFVGTMLVDAYAKCGSLPDARRIFELMPKRDVVSWNAMILGYAQMEQGDSALQLYTRMQLEGVAQDDRTYVAALLACGSMAGVEKGRDIHAELAKTGSVTRDAFLASSLIDMYGKCGSMLEAQQLFDALPTRNVVTWSALIAGYARQGDCDLVFDLFQTMTQEGIEPNGVTFVSLLAACSHSGLVDKGEKYFQAMTADYCITPALKHYTCMVDLLGRAGEVDKAMAMVQAMPFQPDGAVWETVLGACKKWGNVELGRLAFECALKLDRNDAAAYVLMSNIYAASQMWDEAREIQTMRLNIRAWKRPGQSWWTDLNGTVHGFLVGDKEHPETNAIYAKLKDLVDEMKSKGYVPHLNSVLRDIPDQEKEDALCGHSEKLAIVYALLKTPKGTTIRIVKNLRVCEDCHTATALISKIEQRTIICRDASRFHIFKDGTCSCGDFW